MQRGFNLSRLAKVIDDDRYWLGYLDDIGAGAVDVDVHLAVFSEPYLSFVLDGVKTVESRFSRVRCAPFQQIRSGDIILVKQSGGRGD